MSASDLIVIGGGIVGLATALRFTERFPGRRVTVLEKEDRLAAHQTGRNSGVIHAGLYYRPGSLKAITCQRGRALLEAFADEHGVPREKCGKVVVAVDAGEAARLDALCERGIANGVACRLISREELLAYEPACAGLRAIRVEDTGIIDYTRVCHAFADVIAARGGSVVTSTRVIGIERRGAEIVARVASGEAFAGRRLVNCAGLHSDRVTAMHGGAAPTKIIPFRGEYYELKPEARRLCRGLIYPVPDPAFPFLGVHLTRLIASDAHGPRVECGPNAVLALAREGYTWSDVDWRDTAETLGYPAFWKFAMRHWRAGAAETWRSLSKHAFVRALQRLVPEITADDLLPAPSGVRAQALAPNGTLLDDFAFEERGVIVNVCNAPSPAATASLAIGDAIVDRLREPR